MSALVIDDEPIARAGLRHALATVDWVHCSGEAAGGLEALAQIQSMQPELLFLDIQMPGMNGLELLQRLQEQGERLPQVIFTTAHAEHAVTAFELGALDYLLKPFGAERLHAALARVRAAFGEPLLPAVDRLTEMLGQGPMSRLFVRSGRSIVPLPVDRVSCFEAVGDYVALQAEGATHVLHLSLNRLQGRLDATRFVRIHRSCIVNLDHVTAFRRTDTGGLVATLRDGRSLPVSRAVAQELRLQAC